MALGASCSGASCNGYSGVRYQSPAFGDLIRADESRESFSTVGKSDQRISRLWKSIRGILVKKAPPPFAQICPGKGGGFLI